MEINTRRRFFGTIAAMAAVVAGIPKLFAQQAPPAGAPTPGSRIRGRTWQRDASSSRRR